MMSFNNCIALLLLLICVGSAYFSVTSKAAATLVLPLRSDFAAYREGSRPITAAQFLTAALTASLLTAVNLVALVPHDGKSIGHALQWTVGCDPRSHRLDTYP